MAATPPDAAVWQISDAPIAHGDGNLFVDHGLVLLGPGSAGPWSPGRDDAQCDGAATRRLATEVQLGDIVLLRSGRSRLIAVGLVASEYLHLPQFADVNGWDLGQARRVRWTLLPDPYDFGKAVFGGGSRPFGPVADPDVIATARQIVAGPLDQWQSAPLPPLPPGEPDPGVKLLGPDARTVPPGTETLAEVFRAAHQPVLLLMDEVLNFLDRNKQRDPGIYDAFHAFIQNLTVALTGLPHCAAVISLPRSQVEMCQEDRLRQDKITKVVKRVAKDLIVADEAEIGEVVRRR